MKCRRCGCTEDDACITDELGNLVDVADGSTLPDGCTACYWVEPDLCSACVVLQPAPLLFDAYGAPLRSTP